MAELTFNSVDELRDYLIDHGYNLSKWGGKHKTVDDMWKEYQEGERSFITSDEHGLVMVTKVLNVTVYDPTRTSKLSEVEIIPAEGDPYTRGYDFVAEKLKPGENTVEGAQRALAEELSLTVDNNTYVQTNQISVQGKVIDPKPSGHYPGIMGEYHVYKVNVVLRKHQMAETYLEVQPRKTTRFEWVPTI